LSKPTDFAVSRGAASSLQRLLAGPTSAVSFLTIVPVPSSWSKATATDLAEALPWLPLVGAAIGALAGAARYFAEPLFGRPVSSALAMVILVAVTGALHQDALADFADGLGVRGDHARRLAAMRDSALGAFAVLTLIGWALLLFTALDSMSRTHGLLALVVAAATGRLAALLHAVAIPPARSDGLGASLRVTPGALLMASLTGAGAALAGVGLPRGALAICACLLIAVLTAALARTAIGGRTGDTLGATVALTELAVCLALVASWR